MLQLHSKLRPQFSEIIATI